MKKIRDIFLCFGAGMVLGFTMIHILIPNDAHAEASSEMYLRDFEVKPSPRLGLAFPGKYTKYYPKLSKAGIGIARIAVSWRHVEPEPGRFEWRALDRRIGGLQDAGLEPFLTFYSDASWGVTPETHKVVKNGTPKNLGDWSNFVAKVVERYDADGMQDYGSIRRPVRYYQVANEWGGPKNRSGGWAATTEELIDYINEAYAAVKSSSQGAQLVLGGIASARMDVITVHEGNADYTIKIEQGKAAKEIGERALYSEDVRRTIQDKVYPVLKEAHYDIGSVHLYGPADRDSARIATYRKIAGNGKPILSSECGGPSLLYEDYTPESHFRAVLERNLNTLSEDLITCLWFLIGEHKGGLGTYGNSKIALFDASRRPKPGYYAYYLLSAMLEDMERVERINSSAFAILRAGGQRIYVAWKGISDSISVPDNLARYDLLRITDLSVGAFSLGQDRHDRSIQLSDKPIVFGADLHRILKTGR